MGAGAGEGLKDLLLTHQCRLRTSTPESTIQPSARIARGCLFHHKQTPPLPTDRCHFSSQFLCSGGVRTDASDRVRWKQVGCCSRCRELSPPSSQVREVHIKEQREFITCTASGGVSVPTEPRRVRGVCWRQIARRSAETCWGGGGREAVTVVTAHLSSHSPCSPQRGTGSLFLLFRIRAHMRTVYPALYHRIIWGAGSRKVLVQESGFNLPVSVITICIRLQ
eukprot:754687-Hanusia_phi.AAC.1